MDSKKRVIARLSSILPGIEKQVEAIMADYRVTKDTVREGRLQKRINVFLTAKKTDGLSPKTLKNYQEMLSAFAQREDKHVTKITRQKNDRLPALRQAEQSAGRCEAGH